MRRRKADYRESGTAGWAASSATPSPPLISERSGRDLSASLLPCRKCRSGMESSPPCNESPYRAASPSRPLVLLLAAGASAVGTGGARPALRGRELLRLRRIRVSGGRDPRPDRCRASCREDRRRSDVGAPTARQVDHRAARDRPDRATFDRMASPLGGLRDRRGGPALSPRAPPLALGVVGRLRGAPARARRPAHRPEPDGDARHLPHDVRHRGGALPRARSRADGIARPSGRWRRIDRVFGSPFRLWAGVFLGCAVATKWSGAFALPFVAGLCTIWAFTGDRRGDRSAVATVGTLVASFRARSPRGLPAELRRVLLSARLRRRTTS